MIGLVVLIFFIAGRVFAPLIANKEGLRADLPVQRDRRSRPRSLKYPFGTDNFGRSVLTLTIWGSRVSLIGRAARDRHLDR